MSNGRGVPLKSTRPEPPPNHGDPPPNWDTFAALRKSKFDILVAGRVELRRQRRDLEVQIEELDKRIGFQLALAGVKSVMVGMNRATLADGTNVRIDKKLLLENGVSADTIEASTVRKPYTYVLISEPKPERGDDE